MASPKIGILTSGTGRKVKQISNSELKELYIDEKTSGRDRNKIFHELRRRNADIPELKKEEDASLEGLKEKLT